MKTSQDNYLKKSPIKRHILSALEKKRSNKRFRRESKTLIQKHAFDLLDGLQPKYKVAFHDF